MVKNIKKNNRKANNKVRNITTIKIYSETKERLDKLKEFKRETYDEILRKMFFILNVLKKNPDKANKILNKIDSSIKRKEKHIDIGKEEYTEVYYEDTGDEK